MVRVCKNGKKKYWHKPYFRCIC
ncbi:hypothetical protein [uncultured Duncaniella sp.]